MAISLADLTKLMTGQAITTSSSTESGTIGSIQYSSQQFGQWQQPDPNQQFYQQSQQYQYLQQQALEQMQKAAAEKQQQLIALGKEFLESLPLDLCDEIQLTPAQYKMAVAFINSQNYSFGGFTQYTWRGVKIVSAAPDLFAFTVTSGLMGYSPQPYRYGTI